MEVLFMNVNEHPETEIDAAIKGKIPKWLNGSLFRLGPGKFDLDEDFRVNHWFDGAGILYRYTIKDGKVTFRSRFLETEAYEKMCTLKRPVFTEFGTRSYPDPCKKLFSRFLSQLIPGDMTDNAIGNVFTMSDELYCVTETCYLWKVDPETLKTVDKVNLEKLISINLASAHPHTDPDGTSYNLGCSFHKGLRYHIIKIPPQPPVKEEEVNGPRAFLKASVITSISSSWKTCFSYYHSFAITENYIILLEQPHLVNTLKLAASVVRGQALIDCMDWTPKEKTKFFVIEKSTGKVTKTTYKSEPFFVFHHVNAYEENEQIVLDLVAYEDPSFLQKYSLEKLRAGIFDESCPPQLRRFVLPVGKEFEKGVNLVSIDYTQATAVKQDNGTIWLTEERLAEPGLEMPTINYKMCNGRKYRYIYGTGAFAKGYYENAVCKYDLKTHEHKIWREKESMYPGELIFVPNPDAKEEDDGVLLCAAVDIRPDFPSLMVVLDAKTFTEIGRAEVSPDVTVRYGVHGHFIKNQN
ncbi:carotenoid-cleaving dioxygenase, mitochondrial-like isoform X2 [Tachypleus tridentatus]|uniref:carotenoid-cleaving dioxygenase, mitochondrial-like isoform X2 n=1 Tax=Tachypleus tridentatus TaxID=6853 RepID=UPI003FD54A90